MGYDPAGTWDWGVALSGASLLTTGLMAVATAATVLTCGAAAPLMVAVAAVTAVAGTLTAINGAAEIVEAGTGYNLVRDTVFEGDQKAYETYRNTTSTVAQVGTAVCGAYYASKGANVCFVAGTPVQTEQGTVPIEAVAVGAMVWAWDEETGDVALKRVVETYINETYELVHVSVNGDEIVATPSHPFYSPDGGWTEASALRAGDTLVLVTGEYVIVEEVWDENLEDPVTVYNFQVEDYHTYYVLGVLVHNACGESLATRRGRQIHQEWNYGAGVAKEQVIGAGARVDGIDRVNRIVYELKPNNPRAIRRGLAQLERYLKILGEEDWAGVLVLYNNK